MVLVDVDEQDEHTEVHTVVLADDPDDIHLARDDRGHILVYDQHMERVDDDPAQAAIRAAEHRDDWPDCDDWEQGPDALRYPFLYETADGDTPDEDKAETSTLSPTNGPSRMPQDRNTEDAVAGQR
jgi:hypothetical protein